jgi:hypothetical protein
MRFPDLPEVFTRTQALDMGISDERLSGMVRRGEIDRLWCGMYATSRTEPVLPAERATRHVVCARAALSHHIAGFVVSHLSAAALHGLPLPLGPTGLVHVTAVDATQRSRLAPGVRIHHADSTPTDVAVVAELPVTGVARTVADCLRSYGARVSVPIADAALHLGLTTPEAIEDQLDRQRRWRGRPRAMQHLPLIDGRRESWLESYAFVLFDEWGLEPPEPQVWVEDAGGLVVGRVDGAWLEDATVLELDGKAKYGVVEPDEVPQP